MRCTEKPQCTHAHKYIILITVWSVTRNFTIFTTFRKSLFIVSCRNQSGNSSFTPAQPFINQNIAVQPCTWQTIRAPVNQISSWQPGRTQLKALISATYILSELHFNGSFQKQCSQVGHPILCPRVLCLRAYCFQISYEPQLFQIVLKLNSQ